MLLTGTIVAIVAVAVAVGLVLVPGGGKVHQARPWLWVHSSIERSPVVMRQAQAPAEPVDAHGVPALLSSDAGVKNAYLRQLENALPPVSRPAHVGFFGHVRTVRSGTLIVRRDELTAHALGGELASSQPWVPSATVAVALTKHTGLLLGGHRLSSLRRGSEIFVGGRGNGTKLTADLIATPAEMQKPKPAGYQSSSSADGSRSAASLRSTLVSYGVATDTFARPHVRLVASAPAATATVASSSPGPAATTPEEQNTVELYSEGPASKGHREVDNPHFVYKVGIGDNCQLLVEGDALVANAFDVHQNFQFVRDGNGFVVVSQDRPTPNTVHQAGPGILDVGLTDPSAYSYYSGWGVAMSLSASVGCTWNTFFGQVGEEFGLGVPELSFAWVNKTTDHLPLSGDRVVVTTPDHCPGADFVVGPVGLGVESCALETLSGGVLRATLRGAAGKPQGIAVSYNHEDVVHHDTAPQGGKLRVDAFSYVANLRAKERLSFLVDGNAGYGLTGKAKPSLSSAQKRAGVFFSYMRKPDQVGPTLPNKHWRSGRDHQWYTGDNRTTTPPSKDELSQGNSNWIHPNQKGPTLVNGDWQQRDGSWRDPEGRIIQEPLQKQANSLTNRGDQKEPEPPDDFGDMPGGWDYVTAQQDVILDHARPSSLLLTLPVAPQAGPRSPCSSETFLDVVRSSNSTPYIHSFDVGQPKCVGGYAEEDFVPYAGGQQAPFFFNEVSPGKWNLIEGGNTDKFPAACSTIPPAIMAKLGFGCPTPQTQSCSIPGGAEGGADLPFTTTGLSCADGTRLVRAVTAAIPDYGTAGTSQQVQGFVCPVGTPRWVSAWLAGQPWLAGRLHKGR